MKKSPLVFIVDDDKDVRKAVSRLIESVGYDCETFSSADEFLLRKPTQRNCCLTADIRMPGITGLELQNELIKRNINIPIIFISGHGTIPMSVKAIKKGAFDFLPKPFNDNELLSSIENAVKHNAKENKKINEKENIKQLFNHLTKREHEVLRWIITGMLNKQIAQELNISLKTVKFHRANIMHKLQALSLAKLIHLAQKAEIEPAKNKIW